MRLIGTLNIFGKDYLIEYNFNKTKESFFVYNTITKEDQIRLLDKEPIRNIILSTRHLENNVKYYDHVVTGLVRSRNGKDVEYWGNLRLILAVIRELNTLKNSVHRKEDILLDEKTEELEGKLHRFKVANSEYHFSYTTLNFNYTSLELNYNNVSLKLWQTEEGSSVVKRYDLEYKKMLDIDSTGLDVIKSLGIKSVDQLRMELDMDWCFDEEGNMTKDYKIIESVEEMQFICKMVFPNVKLLAVDIESTGLEFNCLEAMEGIHKDHIVGVGMSWSVNQGRYAPLDHEYIDNLPTDIFYEMIKPYFETIPIVTHNGIFDAKCFYDVGIYLNMREDTLLLAFHLNPVVGKGFLKLKMLTRKRYGHETPELEDIFGGREMYHLFRFVPKDVTTIYACADVDYTLRLCFDMHKELPEKQKKLYAMDVRLALELSIDEYYGCPIDTKLIHSLSDINNKDLARLEDLIYRFVGQVGFLTQETLKWKEAGLTDKEIEQETQKLTSNPQFSDLRYEFKISSNDELAKVMYNVLNYPVVRLIKKSQKPSVDKFALKDLLKYNATIENNWLETILKKQNINPDMDKFVDKYGESTLNYFKKNVISSIVDHMEEFNPKDEELILVDEAEFKKYKYPFAYLLQKYRKLDKLRTAFFEPFIKDNKQGRIFKGFKMASADTARIIISIQTLIGQLKKLVSAPNGFYMCVFDFAQFEYRIMAGESGQKRLIERLNHPEADYHREGGSMVIGKPPEDMTKEERDDMKVINFAYPYGMGERALAESRFGSPVTEEALQWASIISAKFQRANWELVALLNSYRKFALDKGYIINKYYRRKYFDLEKQRLDEIERQAGNYPIQSTQREMFALARLRLGNRLYKEGLRGKIANRLREKSKEDKVYIPVLVHDEMVCIIDNSIHPFHFIKMVYEECMLEIENHPKYYCGISIVDNWYEGKSDLYELPIRLVERFIKEWNENPNMPVPENKKKFVLNRILAYAKERLMGELLKLQPNLSQDNVDFSRIVPNFKDYFLKPRAMIWMGCYRKYKKKDPNDELMAALEKMLIDHYGGPITVKYPDGSIRRIDKNVEILPTETLSLDKEQEDLFEVFDEDDSLVMSVSVDELNRHEDSFKIKGTNTADEKKDYWELIDFGVKKKRFGKNDSLLAQHSDIYTIRADGMKEGQFKKLLEFLAKNHVEDGFPVEIIFHKKKHKTKYRLKNDIDRDELSRITGTSFFSASM